MCCQLYALNFFTRLLTWNPFMLTDCYISPVQVVNTVNGIILAAELSGKLLAFS